MLVVHSISTSLKQQKLVVNRVGVQHRLSFTVVVAPVQETIVPVQETIS